MTSPNSQTKKPQQKQERHDRANFGQAIIQPHPIQMAATAPGRLNDNSLSRPRSGTVNKLQSMAPSTDTVVQLTARACHTRRAQRAGWARKGQRPRGHGAEAGGLACGRPARLGHREPLPRLAARSGCGACRVALPVRGGGRLQHSGWRRRPAGPAPTEATTLSSGSCGMLQHLGGFGHDEVVSVSLSRRLTSLLDLKEPRTPRKPAGQRPRSSAEARRSSPRFCFLLTTGAAWASRAAPSASRRGALDHRGTNRMFIPRHEGSGIHTIREGMTFDMTPETRLYTTLYSTFAT